MCDLFFVTVSLLYCFGTQPASRTCALTAFVRGTPRAASSTKMLATDYWPYPLIPNPASPRCLRPQDADGGVPYENVGHGSRNSESCSLPLFSFGPTLVSCRRTRLHASDTALRLTLKADHMAKAALDSWFNAKALILKRIVEYICASDQKPSHIFVAFPPSRCPELRYRCPQLVPALPRKSSIPHVPVVCIPPKGYF